MTKIVFVLLSKTWAKHMVKISKKYVKGFLIYNCFSEVFSTVSAILRTLWSQNVHKKAGFENFTLLVVNQKRFYISF